MEQSSIEQTHKIPTAGAVGITKGELLSILKGVLACYAQFIVNYINSSKHIRLKTFWITRTDSIYDSWGGGLSLKCIEQMVGLLSADNIHLKFCGATT